MKGVIGLLLLVVGVELAYLVLAGKLPLQLKTKSTGSGGGGVPFDFRKSAIFRTPRVTPARGYRIPRWGGLQ
jgi:hypothetical protein